MKNVKLFNYIADSVQNAVAGGNFGLKSRYIYSRRANISMLHTKMISIFITETTIMIIRVRFIFIFLCIRGVETFRNYCGFTPPIWISYA